jgi:hypothetical protein
MAVFVLGSRRTRVICARDVDLAAGDRSAVACTSARPEVIMAAGAARA